MAAAGLGDDLLLANEVARPAPPRRHGRRATPASPSPSTREATVDAAAAGRHPRGADRRQRRPPPLRLRARATPARLADLAARRASSVRGVMGYEGHLMMVGRPRPSGAARSPTADGRCCCAAHADVGGDVVSAGGTGTYDLNDLGHRDPGRLLRPDGHRLRARSACRSPGAVRAGHRHLGQRRSGPCATPGSRPRHGPRQPDASTGATVWFCSDEHITFAPGRRRRRCRVGDRVRVDPRPRRPDVALHERAPPRRRRRGASTTLADRPPRLVSRPQAASASERRGRPGRGGDRRASRPAVISANVRPSPSTGHERPGRSRTRRRPAARRRSCPRTTPSHDHLAPVGPHAPAATVRNRAVRSAGGTPSSSRSSCRCRRTVALLAGVAGRVDARRAAEGVDLEPGVVGDRRLARSPRRSAARLEPGVALERVAVLDDVGDVGRPRQQLDGVAEDRRDLGHLVGVGRWRRTSRHRATSAAAAAARPRTRACSVDDLGDARPRPAPSSASSSPRLNGHALGRALHLDEAARRRSSPRSCRPRPWSPRRRAGRAAATPSTMPTRDRGAVRGAAGASASSPACTSRVQRVVQREVAAADRRRAGAAVGLEHVAVDDDLALAEQPHVARRPAATGR